MIGDLRRDVHIPNADPPWRTMEAANQALSIFRDVANYSNLNAIQQEGIQDRLVTRPDRSLAGAGFGQTR
jgi:hypothetical protein